MSNSPAWTRRDLLRLSAGGAAAGVLGSCSSWPRSVPARRPNVIVFFDDQLRADACGVYGGKNIETPNIDRLAAEGMTFANAVSPCPLCTPFRGMLQTGRYPTHSGLLLNWVEPDTTQRCIAHVFRDAGYRTGFIGKWHLAAGALKYAGKQRNNGTRKRVRDYRRQNPDTEFVPPGAARLGYDHWEAFNFHCKFKNPFYYKDEKKKLTWQGYETDVETDSAISFMKERQAAQEPFFLMVAPHPPHPPFGPKHCPPGYLEKIPRELHWDPNVPQGHRLRKNPLRARCYYAMAKNVDDNLGRILDYLDQSGLAEDTILVFTSDHGEMLGSRNRMNKMVPYREAVRIPLIVRWPGRIPAGRKSDDLYGPMDNLATLPRLAGLTVPDSADGVDMSPVLLGRHSSSREAQLMANYVSYWDYFETGTTWPEWRGVKTRTHTYAKWLDGREELYDDLADPFQQRNLALGEKDETTLKAVREHLRRLLADAHDEFLPGTAYGDWYDDGRHLVRNALGPVARG